MPLLVALCFVAGFATEKWLADGRGDSVQFANSKSVFSSNNIPPQSTAPTEPTAAQPNEVAWQDKDYSGNWDELLNIVTSLKPQDESLRPLLTRLRQYSTSEKKALLKATLAHPEKNRLALIVGWAFQSIVLDSFDEGLAAFSELSPTDQRQYAWLIANSLGQNDAERAWAWLDTVESGDPRYSVHTDQIPALRSMVLSNLILYPEKHIRSLELAQSVADLRVRESLTDRVITAMLDHSMEDTLENLEAFPELSERVTDTLIQKWALEDTYTASNYLKNNPDLVTRRRLVEVAKNLINKNDYSEFNQLYESLDSDRMKSFMAYRAAVHKASHDIDESINWIRTIPDGMSRRQAGAAAIKEMGYVDNLEDHIQVIESTFDGYEQERFELYRETLEIWQKRDPAKVADAIRNLPDRDRNLQNALETSLIKEGDGK